VAAPLILVVEDDPDILEAICEILLEEGYRVARARDGLSALDRVRAERPALVLLDLMMPVMDGPAFARALRSRGTDGDVPLVVITADNKPERAVEAGADAVLPKPFAADALLAAVRAWIGDGSSGPGETPGHPRT
jgi:CheY-like chemotaxis protein